jgi:chaperone modulatory protein CbpM
MTSKHPPSSPGRLQGGRADAGGEAPGELSGTLLDEQAALTITEISRICAVRTEYIVELVEEGLIVPAAPSRPDGDTRQAWRFTGTQMRQARIAARLHADLGINTPGVALALQLLEEVEALRARLHARGTLDDG